MKVTLYLPYYDYNDGAFDVNDNYYDENEYINAISDEYNKNKDIVYNSMIDFKNGSQGLLSGADGKMYKLGQKTSQSEDKVAYSSCESTLFNDSGDDETVDGLIDNFAKQESFVEMMMLDLDTAEEEFETELSLWKNEHNGINEYKALKGEDWAWVNEPKRDVKMSFENNAGETLYAVLRNCKIMDIVDRNTFIVFVEKISLIDKI